MGSDPQFAKYPNLSLSQDIFNLSNPACHASSRQSSLKKLQAAIKEHNMAPLYRHLAHPVEGVLNSTGEGSSQPPAAAGSSPGSTGVVVMSDMLARRPSTSRSELVWDEKLYDRLVAENKRELDELTKEEEEAAEAAGETEVQAARGKKAELWARVGDKVCVKLSSFFAVSLPDIQSDMLDLFRIKPSRLMRLCLKILVS